MTKKGIGAAMLVAVVTVMGLVSCHQTAGNASIAGTWAFYSEQDHITIAGAGTWDTTAIAPAGGQLLLNANGTFGGNFFGAGTYAYQASTLTINDGTYIDYYHVAQLDAHTLRLTFTDTISTSPLKTDDITYSFTR
ncbi:MAG: hypothetical protein JST83_16540 [Bacteroidetes bacterium]|nr:hypothetical protein [Bacteroidota bacterium]